MSGRRVDLRNDRRVGGFRDAVARFTAVDSSTCKRHASWSQSAKMQQYPRGSTSGVDRRVTKGRSSFRLTDERSSGDGRISLRRSVGMRHAKAN